MFMHLFARKLQKNLYLEPLGGSGKPQNPYLVIASDREIIGEHSDIFTPLFLDFLLNYMAAYPR